MDVYAVGSYVQNEVSQNFLVGGLVYDTVPAEAVGAVEAGYLRDFAEDRVMIWSHFVEAGPGAFRVHGQIFEYWDAVGGAGQDFLDERGLEIGFIAGSLFGIV